MKEPPRWIEAEGSAPARVRELFQSARPTRTMTPLERARSAEQIARIAATPAGVSPLVFLKNLAATILGIATAGAIFGGGTGFGTERFETRHSPTLTAITPIVNADASVKIAMPVQQELEANLVSSSQQTFANTPPKRSFGMARKARISNENLSESNARTEDSTPKSRDAKDSESADDSFARELALLEEAQRLLRTNPSDAMARITEHRKSFPQGRLQAEREFLAIDVLLRLGNKAVARARAKALLERADGSPYATRIQRKLAEMDSVVEKQ